MLEWDTFRAAWLMPAADVTRADVVYVSLTLSLLSPPPREKEPQFPVEAAERLVIITDGPRGCQDRLAENRPFFHLFPPAS